MLGVATLGSIWHHDRRDRPQPVNRLSRLAELPQMRIVGGQKTVRQQVRRQLLYCRNEIRRRASETAFEEVSSADNGERQCRSRARVETHRGLGALDCQSQITRVEAK